MKLKIFLVIETILYFGFLWIDISGTYSSDVSAVIKFSSIVLCLFYLFSNKSVGETKDPVLMKIALLFTVMADLFLLLLDMYILGLICFIIVQMCYLYRVRIHRRLQLWINLVVFFVGLILLLETGVEIDFLLLLSLFYFISITRNTIETVLIMRRQADVRLEVIDSYYTKSQLQLFMVGMILFLLCDINVGIFNLTFYQSELGEIYQNIYNLSAFAMWFFYLPSQVILTLSGSKKWHKKVELAIVNKR